MSVYASKCPKLPWMIDFHSDKEGVPRCQRKAAFQDTRTDYLTELNIESQIPHHKLTGIVGTLGPSCDDAKILEEMMHAGMTMLMIKMCHCTDEVCHHPFDLIKEATDNYSRRIGRVYPLAIAIDIRGADIRTGSFKDPSIVEIRLEQGDFVCLTTDPSYEEHVTENMIYVDYDKMTEVCEPGDHVTIGNSGIRLSALEIVGSIMRCIVENAGAMLSRSSVTLPGVPIDLPLISEKDKRDLLYGVKNGVDAFFLSGVRDEKMIVEVKEFLGLEAPNVLLISKIDTPQGICYIDEIIKKSDGVLIDRGALGNELDCQKIFLAQKAIIAKCNKAGIPAFCCNQVLESMTKSLIPTNSEVSDIANAIIDGCDLFVLTNETLIGENPIKSIATLTAICKEAEPAIHQKQIFSDLTSNVLTPIEPIYTVAISAVEASLKCCAAVIIVLTVSGRSAGILSRYRPCCPIIAITRCLHIARKMHFYRGVDPILYINRPRKNWEEDVDQRIQLGITWGKVSGYIRAGDALVIVRGSRPGTGFTNSMRIVYASDFDALPPPEPAKRRTSLKK